MTAVSYQNIRKDFGAVTVLENINLTIEDGEFVVLLGPSGCGKSTLLRMTAGLETVTEGTISIGDRIVNTIHPRDRDIAMVFQNYALYPLMKVRDNIAFALQIKKLPKDQIDEKVRWAADILNLTEYLDRYPRQLSGGQRQRVAMGRAIVRDPAVFLFDEPLSNLDAKLRAQMRFEIRDLHNRLKTTTIYVTHDQIEAMTMADKIVVMNHGVIAQIGTPIEIFNFPNTTFVAEFVGSPTINLLHGQIEHRAKKQWALVGDKRLPLPPGLKLDVGARIIYGIRPLHITLKTNDTAAKPGSNGDKNLVANVLISESTGSETEVRLLLGDQQLRAMLHGQHAFEPGSEVRLSIDENWAVVFDADSQERIN
ncbi:hypothetical protein MNBD_ALPHA09-933 [hydrothermal vent metagenome]|uniref:ABC transporter domain-containing protein n=1 Tax=hydrothermal vent metagenome TaxID=652676 RepID=A0A3B0T5D2_9ZZZZ